MATSNQNENKIEHASLNLPQGGGAINGIGEKFQANAATGTGGYSIPLPISPGRSGFAPSLGLSYDSGGGNSPFGLGWSVSVPSITRKTNKELPQYNDAHESDTFLLAGAEDLVPKIDAYGNREVRDVAEEGTFYKVYSYRPRTEGMFAKIERWVNGETHWRVTTKEGITSRYGISSAGRIADPNLSRRVYTWLLEESWDLYGNSIRYEYKEDRIQVDDYRSAVNSYLKKVLYSPFKSDDSRYHFQLLFDYGEHMDETPEERLLWSDREDAFSSYRSGFEIRTARRCNNVLMFHNFPAEGTGDSWELVKKLELTYDSSPSFSYLTEAKIWGIKGVDRKALPPLKFNYSRSEIDPVVKQIDQESLNNLPVGLDNRRWQWIDVYGEGLPGIAVRDGGTVYFKENLGNGEFGPLHTVAKFPNLNSSDSISLSDIDGDGNNEFTVKAEGINGYYRFRKDKWEEFTPFESSPTINTTDPNSKMIDLNGDGRADILITEDRVMRWYPSRGEKGYDESRVAPKPTDENRGPALVFADALESIYTADMTGDGLTDIVRIRNGEVCYWPNEGYGHFGPKVTMKHSPVLERGQHQVNQQYIKLGDIDGSGTTDLLYFGNGKVQYWFNESGNGYSTAQELPFFPPIDSLSSVSLIDLKGTGTMSLVWSSNRPGQERMQLSYVDLMTEKPHLLKSVNNSMGNETYLSYESSIQQYLRDKKAGTPWITKLHFPVHVLTKVTTKDLIGKNSQSVRYKYRHGCFDSHEREFRGFGAVETIDTKSFEEYTAEGGTEEYVAPILTKQWFHTGIFDFANMGKQYEHEYYQGDKIATDNFALPDTNVEEWESLTTEELMEAYRTLKSSALRSEVYELGTTDPYSVSESNSVVRCLQKKGTNKHAVFMVVPGESISFSYDQNKDDPRVSHSFALDVDEYGVTRESASVIYPRRIPQHPDQGLTAVTVSTVDVDHVDNAEMFRIGVPIASKSYEIGKGLPITANDAVTLDQLRVWVDQALLNEIPFDQTIQPGEMKARLLSWSRNFYWNEEQTEALDHGLFTEKLLVHHVESTRFTQAMLDDVFGSALSPQDLIDSEYRSDSGYFWDHGLIQHYTKGNFYLPWFTEEPGDSAKSLDGNWVKAYYDEYDMVVLKTEDANGNIAEALGIDYRTMQPKRMKDPNDNFSEVLCDELGMVIATTSYGTELRKHGDAGEDTAHQVGDLSLDSYLVQANTTIDDVVANPDKYLQGASSFFYYDMNAFLQRQEPLQYVQVARKYHVHDSEIPAGADTTPVISLGYSDGFGRELQSKVKVDGGFCWKLEDGVYVEFQKIDFRWLTSGRTVYNNKEKPVKQYEPFYSITHRYEGEESLTFGVTPLIHYDALGRVTHTDLPDGTSTMVKTTPWEILSYDQNDLNADQKNDHWNTPSVAILDSLGRTCQQEVYLTEYGKDTAEKLVTTSTFDITGNPLTVTDPRGIEAFRYTYDMAGTPIRTWNVDACNDAEGAPTKGDRVFMARFGQPLVSLDNKDTKVRVYYDLTNRPLYTKVHENGDVDGRINEVIVYGDSEDFEGTVSSLTTEEERKARNLRGKILHHWEESGFTQFPYYSFKGEMLLKDYAQRELNGVYDSVANWDKNSAAPSTCESESFYTRVSYDALGRVKETLKPDLSVTTPAYHASGTLKTVTVTPDGGSPTVYVTDIQYNEKGQRESITYGNGIKTTYEYDEKNYRLTKMYTADKRHNAPTPAQCQQYIEYQYDAVGNITEITDLSHSTVVTNNQVVGATSLFEYDALYRLTRADGREKIGLNENVIHSPYVERYHTDIKSQTGNSHQVQNYTRRYQYDKGNNLTQIAQTLGNTFTRDIAISQTSNRGILVPNKVNPNTITGIDALFDKNGNQTEMEHLEYLLWDYRNMISKAKKKNSDDVEYYIYNSGGNRTRKISLISGYREEKIYLDGVEIKRRYGGTTHGGELLYEQQDHHVMDDTKRIAIVSHATVNTIGTSDKYLQVGAELNPRYQFGNHLGSASLELDKEGKVISYQEYFPFGGTSYRVGEISTEYRFTGKERDEFTGLYYFGARYYCDWIGRWMSADPKRENSDGLNLYAYCRNNPVTLTDPNGMTAMYFAPESSLHFNLHNEIDAYLDAAADRTTTWNSDVTQLPWSGGTLADKGLVGKHDNFERGNANYDAFSKIFGEFRVLPLKLGLDLIRYKYEPRQNLFYATQDAIQQGGGYTDAYDIIANEPGLFNIDFFDIAYEHGERQHHIRGWKGEYWGAIGAEIGHYMDLEESDTEVPDIARNLEDKYGLPGGGTTASKDTMLKMGFTLYDTKGSDNPADREVLFTRYMEKHWWVIGMQPNLKEVLERDNIKDDLVAEFYIDFGEDKDHADAVITALESENKVAEGSNISADSILSYSRDGNVIMFQFKN